VGGSDEGVLRDGVEVCEESSCARDSVEGSVVDGETSPGAVVPSPVLFGGTS